MRDSNHLHSMKLSRRQLLNRTACGFGGLALAGLFADAAKADEKIKTLALRKPMFAPRAKRVIFIFMQGGPSHVDSLDYKPELIKSDGKSIDFTGVVM